MREVWIRGATSLDRIDLIEGIVSFVWTTRYDSFGDFVFTVPYGKFEYTSLAVNNYVEIPESRHLMMIESVFPKKTDEGSDLIEVRGRSLEAFLQERVVTPNTTDDYWTLTGTVGFIATELVRRVCVVGEFTVNDIIPNLVILEQDASTITRTVKLKPQDLYKSVQDLIKEDKLGVRIYLNRDTKNFEFRVYRGTNRSASQSENNRIVFSEDLGNLSNTNFLKSNVGYKNVAYVNSGSLIRRVQIGSGSFLGMRRRVMYVDASDIKNPTNEKLDNRGRQELAKQPFTLLLDGEIQETRSYRFGIDYFLGDVVSIKGEDGTRREGRITEHVITYDENGQRSYPTFTSFEPGT